MPIVRRSVVDQIEITRSGDVGVRIGLLLVDGDQVLSTRWHRTLVPLDACPRAQLAAVNEHLAQMGEEPLPEGSITDIADYHRLSMTKAGME